MMPPVRLVAGLIKDRAERRNAEKLYAQFERSCAAAAASLQEHEQIAFVRADNITLHFETVWMIAEVRGERLLVARIRASINPHFDMARVWVVESGTKDRTYPLYFFDRDKPEGGWFCFGDGDRAKFVDDLCSAGEYEATVYAMLDSFAHINTSDELYALEHYARANEL